MDDKLKDLLKRLTGASNVEVLTMGEHECSVVDELAQHRELLASFPSEDAPLEVILAFGLARIGALATSLAKEGNIKELERKLVLAKKPDEVDLEDDEHKHVRLHLEADALGAQLIQREAVLLSRFLDIVRTALVTERKGSDS